MNPELSLLHPYPFEKLAKLKAGCTPPVDLPHLNLSIGEPQHPTPEFIVDALTRTATRELGKYPTTKGLDTLRQAIAIWINQRFQVPASALDINKHILPVNGTREALFAFAQAVISRQASAAGKNLVLMPNPFYQIYEGATLLAGAQPYFVNCTAESGFQTDFAQISAEVWQKCQMLYICSPANPSGAVLQTAQMQQLIELADKYDFVIAADECYSELYFDENQPPKGLLQVCAEMGRLDFSRCVIFHSLSKRSNAPGLRSGFVAGDAKILEKFLLYRTYHGCAMSQAVQLASIAAWQDEQHVIENRVQYRRKFKAVADILSPVLPAIIPEASFYFWLKTPIADDEFTRRLFNQYNVTVLAGRYLSREAHGINPGEGFVRMALVPEFEDCVQAAERVVKLVKGL